MAVDKKISYDIQGGARNYLGKQKEVKAPIKWKSSPDSPETELAYITKAEKDLLVKKDLHGSLKGGVNRGPSGIMSLDGYGSFDSDDPSKDTGMSGAATSAAESGRNTSDTLAEGASYKDVQDYRNAFIAAGGGQRVNPGFFDSRNTVSPEELRLAKLSNPRAFKKTRGGGIMDFFTGGGFLGNIVRSLGQRFGLGKTYDQPTYDMSGINTRVYEGTMDPSVNPDYYNDLGNELMLSTKASPNVAKGFVTATGPDFKTLLNQNKNRNTLANVEFNRMGSYLDGVTDQELYGNFNTIKPTNLNDFEGINSLKLETPKQQAEDDFLKGAMADAETDNRTLLEKLLNPDLDVDEALDKEEQKRKREQELLQQIMQS